MVYGCVRTNMSNDLDFSPLTKMNLPHYLDKSYEYIRETSGGGYTHSVIDWELKKDILSNAELPAYQYIKFGKLLGSVLQEELSFQAFYMAHLKDHRNVKTNAELQFETYNVNVTEGDVENE
jgi:hypothetical protein